MSFVSCCSLTFSYITVTNECDYSSTDELILLNSITKKGEWLHINWTSYTSFADKRFVDCKSKIR